MKNLIVYATKHGCAENCSRILNEKLNGETTAVNIRKGQLPELAAFDNIIIGGSIYIGKIQKEISEFCSKNMDLLKTKKIAKTDKDVSSVLENNISKMAQIINEN